MTSLGRIDPATRYPDGTPIDPNAPARPYVLRELHADLVRGKGRALLTSTQLSTYYVGYREVAAIGAARPGGTSLHAWHDAMLAHGSPSPRHLRALLGV